MLPDTSSEIFHGSCDLRESSETTSAQKSPVGAHPSWKEIMRGVEAVLLGRIMSPSSAAGKRLGIKYAASPLMKNGISETISLFCKSVMRSSFGNAALL